MTKRAKNERVLNFYGESQPSSGKTSGVLLSILNVLTKMHQHGCSNEKYLVICSTYDMAYASYQLAQRMQANFRHQFLIGFLSKETDLNLSDFEIIIATKSEAAEKINEKSDIIKHVIFDDADAYLISDNMAWMVERLPNSSITILTTNKMSKLPQMFLMENFAIRRYSEENDNRHYVEILSHRNTMSMDHKLQVLVELSQMMKDACPLGQMIIFCYVISALEFMNLFQY